jgi:hypothetical protein
VILIEEKCVYAPRVEQPLQIRDVPITNQDAEGNQSSEIQRRLLSPERAALCEPCLATGRLAENGCASLADDNGLGVREDGGDGEATRALDVHEEGSGSGDESLIRG